jgi:hypothetical protein
MLRRICRGLAAGILVGVAVGTAYGLVTAGTYALLAGGRR